MDKKWFWIELIGFDREQPDFGVSDFLSRIPQDYYGVSLLLYSIDFVNMHESLTKEITLSPGVCSYAGHSYNEERKRQEWTNQELKGLIEELHQRGLKVLLAVFDLFRYYDDEENPSCVSAFAAEHTELHTCMPEPFRKVNQLNPMHHMRDGKPYRDFLIEKLALVLHDYRFDGIQFADGLSSQRLPLQMGDFSDDVVNQFLAATDAELPEEMRSACDDVPERSDARYRYILSKLRCSYTRFIAGWYADFYKRLSVVLHSDGKLIIFNNAWTTGPFEALFRYGIDYTAFRDANMDGIMMEDEGSFMPLMASSDLGGFAVPYTERQYKNHTYFLRQLSLKLASGGLPVYNMTPLRDTQEGWNMIDAAPFEVQKMIARRKNARITTAEGVQKASDGCFYCLSDGMEKAIWDKIGNWDRLADLPPISGVCGLTALYCSEIRYDELEEFVLSRKPSAELLYEDLITAGVPIVSMMDAENIPSVSVPLIAANLHLYPKKLISALEVYQGMLFVLGTESYLARMPDCVISETENGMKLFVYNCPELSGFSTEVTAENKPVSTDFADAHGGIWTAALRYIKPSAGFLRLCRKTVERLSAFPAVTNGADCRMTTYLCDDGRIALMISNDSYSAEMVQLRLPWKIAAAQSLNKPHWYKVAFKDNTLRIRINNRAMETILLTPAQ